MAETFGKLAGKRIAVPETRELERFAGLLEQNGATVLRCPLVGILDAPDSAPVQAWLGELVAGRFQDVIFLTGEGIRRLMSAAERAGLAATVLTALENVRKITRGPKPVMVLRTLGLKQDLSSATATTDGVIATLSAVDLNGHTVGVQLYGDEPNLPLMDFLQRAGAIARPVAPYVYAPAAHDEQVVDLIREIAARRVDVLAFTSASQVTRLLDVGNAHKLTEELRAGLEHTRIAAVGPVVADTLKQHGLNVAIIPQRSFVLHQLVHDIIANVERGL